MTSPTVKRIRLPTCNTNLTPSQIMSNNFKKYFTGTGVLSVPTLVQAFWGLVILCALVVCIAIGICLLLKRLADIPPPDRERQIRDAFISDERIADYYTNHGMPPSFIYCQSNWPMTYWDTHPLVIGTNIYNYFELVQVAEVPPPHIVSVCARLGEWTNLVTVGENGPNRIGFTNQDLEVFIVNGQWDIKPTKFALTNYASMFWTAVPKTP